MMRASASGNVRAVSDAIAAGALPNATNPIGQTALHIASIWNHVEVGRVLIAAGANVLVAGGSVFSAADPAIAIKELIGGDCPSDMEMANV